MKLKYLLKNIWKYDKNMGVECLECEVNISKT